MLAAQLQAFLHSCSGPKVPYSYLDPFSCFRAQGFQGLGFRIHSLAFKRLGPRVCSGRQVSQSHALGVRVLKSTSSKSKIRVQVRALNLPIPRPLRKA